MCTTCLWPLHFGLLLVLSLHKEDYLQIFKCVSFWLHGFCSQWEGWVPVNQVNHTNRMDVVCCHLIDRPQSVPQLSCNRTLLFSKTFRLNRNAIFQCLIMQFTTWKSFKCFKCYIFTNLMSLYSNIFMFLPSIKQLFRWVGRWAL